MKLLRCHIDNFGGLSNFDFEFSDGLTVIHEPNGFGKSTLAAFIKAIFYGLPRTGGRDITNNERKKYLPWQGGSYGGNLDFSMDGFQYRVYREFGRTAAGDKYKVYDLTNRRPTTRFPSNLGEAIFQLDAESYARSTYMPQQDFGSDGFSTDSIRAKLTNLVNATDDLNNCDTALNALYSRRLQYETYRGSRGKIPELNSSIRSLESDINGCYEKVKVFPELNQAISDLTREKVDCEENIKRLQEQYRMGTAVVLLRQKQGCEKNIESCKSVLNDIEREFPNGVPSKEEVQEQRDKLKAVVTLEMAQKLYSISEDELRCYETCEHVFADSAAVSKDLADCQHRYEAHSELQAKLSAFQLTEEEKAELNVLKRKFSDGLPEEKEIENCTKAIEEISRKKGELRQTTLSSSENSKLYALRRFFASGKVEDEQVKALDQMRIQRDRLKATADSFALPDDDNEKLQRLNSVFCQRVPEEEEIDAQQRNSRRIAELEAKKNTFITVHKQEAVPQTGAKLPLAAVGLGVALLVAGIICTAVGYTVPGIIVVILGATVLLASVVLKTHSTTQPTIDKTVTQGAITAEEERELSELKNSLQAFLSTFYSETEPADKVLSSLFTDRSDFLRISKQSNELKEKRDESLAKAADLQYQLEKFFIKYYPTCAYSDSMIEDMRKNIAEYKSLSEMEEEKAGDAHTLRNEINSLDLKIRNFLHIGQDKNPSIELQELRDARSNYIRLTGKEENLSGTYTSLKEKCVEEAHAMEEILAKYAQLPTEPSNGYAERIKNLRKLYDSYKDIAVRVRENKNSSDTVSKERKQQETSLQSFLSKYQLPNDNADVLLNHLNDTILKQEKAKEDLGKETLKLKAWEKELASMEVPSDFEEYDSSLSIDDIRRAETDIGRKLKDITESLESKRRERNNLREVAERVPQLQDELETKRADLLESEHNRDLLDAAQEYLKVAKDSLSTSYVGRVEDRFLYYMNVLLGDKLGRVTLDKDLKMRIEKEGEARSIASFSVGMRDCVLICMRLALVDVMFEAEQPCVILDDPFVNLDEEHTRHALELLENMAKTRQVIYLVCNESRVAS